MRAKFIFLFFLIGISTFIYAEKKYERMLKWENNSAGKLDFENAIFPDNSDIPYYFEKIEIADEYGIKAVRIINPVYEAVSDSLLFPALIASLEDEIQFEYDVIIEQKKQFVQISLFPFKRSKTSSVCLRLKSFDLIIENELSDVKTNAELKNIQNSVLASGTWYKIKVEETGIFKIDYNMMQEMGFDMATLDPRNLRLYGNGGGMISEENPEVQQDDLLENAIYIKGEEDGSFDQGDYILFYGESPHQWEYSQTEKSFKHQYHAYSDFTFYFISPGSERGKRIETISHNTNTYTQLITDFADHDFYEKDERNLINSGRTWYGEVFDVDTEHEFDFEFSDVLDTKDIQLTIDVAARSSSNSTFNIELNNQFVGDVSVSGINFNSSYPPYARTSVKKFELNSSDELLNLKLKYHKPNTSSIGWLNYIEIQLWRNLIYRGGQLSFRNPEYFNQSGLKFEIEKRSDFDHFWDVSDLQNIKSVSYFEQGQKISFIRENGGEHEYIIADENSYKTPEVAGPVNNQNYHAINPVDLIIVSSPEFFSEAIRLGNFHEQEGLTYCLVEPQKLYNEFSSGAPDVGAIRNFVRYLYQKAEKGQEPKYLLLFGDASFDYKDRIENNSNLVPTWESKNGVNITQSFMSDDFFGLLDVGEGKDLKGGLDIGIGRLPVADLDEAKAVVDKIIDYSSNSPSVMGPWRNKVCFVGDDQDYNAYVSDSESISEELKKLCPNADIQKIYFDAYPQISTPGGERYPEVNKAINKTVEKGALIINYIGHGGETGWAHERVLELSDINSWNNKDKLPIFITATCEFTRLDDPVRKSAGEYVLTNPNGGGIALLTTTRATSSGGNFQLNKNVINAIFKNFSQSSKRLGDVILKSKNAIGNTINGQKFVLVGDPAMKIALPGDSLAVLKINNKAISIQTDTLKALSAITIQGSVFNSEGVKLPGYNGTLYPVIYDKPTTYRTLAQNATSFEYDFKMYNNVLYNGEISVQNGDFSFSFIVPRDIAYNYDFGKISLYSKSEAGDAWGSFSKIIVGGFDESAVDDGKGPEIEVYLNDHNFSSGDQVPAKSVLYARISDESGINTIGSGIGHDIVAVINDETSKPIVLNDFFKSDLNSYKSGSISYELDKLENGVHSLKLKAWDVFNNSNSKTIDFIVAGSDEFLITSLKNFPNPFINETTFQFQLNREYSSLYVEIQIYNLEGKRLKVISKSDINNSRIIWDGKTDNDRKLDPGIYVYKILIKLSSGETAEKQGKLLII